MMEEKKKRESLHNQAVLTIMAAKKYGKNNK